MSDRRNALNPVRRDANDHDGTAFKGFSSLLSKAIGGAENELRYLLLVRLGAEISRSLESR